MLRAVDSNEKVLRLLSGECGNPNKWFLTEDGLYEVLMQSRKPIAKQFKAKVKEILKEIRKTGAYSTKSQQQTQKALTYRGRRIILIKDLSKIMNQPRNSIYYYLRCKKLKLVDGTDYNLVKGIDLREFKRENNMPELNIKSLFVIFESGVKKLCTYLNIQPNIPQTVFPARAVVKAQSLDFKEDQDLRTDIPENPIIQAWITEIKNNTRVD